MEHKSWVQFLFLVVFFLQLSDSQAQKIEKKITINWKENHIENFSEDQSWEFLLFDNATYLVENPTLPCYAEQFPIDQLYKNYDITISDAQYEAMSAHDASLLPSNFHHRELQVEVRTMCARSKKYAALTIIPFIETTEGHFSKLVAATISFQGRNPETMAAKRTYTAHSILSTGQWYNFALTQTGIYKITYADMLKMGVNPPIQSANIALFGNGGAMLPEANAAERPDDLLELPISIHDGNDGSFDDGDYLLFYGQAPHHWNYDTTEGHFYHATNLYCDSSFYFITTTPGVGEKKRISIVNNAQLSETRTSNSYRHHEFIEQDLHNFAQTGREWFGDIFDATTTRNYGFNIPGYRSEEARVTISAAGQSQTSSNFSILANGNNIGTMQLSHISNVQIATLNKETFTFIPNSSSLSLQLTYSKPAASSSAYLDWIELDVPCTLSMHSDQVDFRDPTSVGEGNVTRFIIQGATNSTRVWDITDPSQAFQLALSNESNGQSFKSSTNILRQFIAFNGSQFLSITPKGRVGNQDLHATSNVEMIIVVHPRFLTEAQRLAEYRNQHGISTQVVTTQQVYNEFSSGSQDPMAIRDYMKMIYDKTGHQYPKYLLLFGRPSYDYRSHVNGTEIFVPNYQYPANNNVIVESGFFANDDTFGLLDDNEGENARGMYDIAVGRFPCSTLAQAKTAVEKSINYTERIPLATSSTQISNFGDWRNVMAFVADDEQSNDFIIDADNYTQVLGNINPNINFDKIYLDAYQQVSNAGGQRYPDVTTAINNRMNRGALFFTYVGHSGKDGWANERVLENSDINKWTNKYNMPVMLTLSCTFGYYDRPAVSPAELAFFNSKGGASALITATREAWSYPNQVYGLSIFNHLFNETDGRYPTVGELETFCKSSYSNNNSTSLAMFILIGDPSMPLAIPTYNIVTDSINHKVIGAQPDTLRALSKVTISGHIENKDGQLLQDFNGVLYPSVYDKKVTATSLVNDPASMPFNFEVQKSILFKGNSTVNNGHFSFTFYVPRDIDYSYGNGKISYYGFSNDNDGAGAFTDFIIGGTDTNGVEDKEGPTIELYLNDENFVNGGITNPNAILIAKVKDNYGINTTGNGIGHDITAILDNATSSPIILNDFYQTDRDSFNSGSIRYNLESLSVGKHNLSVRAWDINNNYSESNIEFEVVSDEKLTLSHVLNYPNPFTTHTDFYFEQNQNGGMFDIQVQIYTISGKLVKTLQSTQLIEGNRSQPIPWDGLDDYGDKLGKGVYMYKLRVRNQNNDTAEVIEKLVIL